MPWQIEWIDEALGIYGSTISDPFSPEERDEYFTALFELWEAASGPLYALFDVSSFAKASDFSSLSDRRFMKMGNYRGKIELICMVSPNTDVFARMVANVGARLLGKPSWFKFFDERDQAIAYLREQATANVEQD